MRGYYCHQCDMNFISKEEKSECFLCHGRLEEKDFSFNFSNTYFGPFKKSLDDAKKGFKRNLWNPFLPFFFRKRNNLQSIVKLYVPVSCYDTHLDGMVEFVCKDKKSDLKYYNQMKCNVDFKKEFVSLNSILPSNCVNSISNTFSYDLFQDSFVDSDTILLDINVVPSTESEKYHEELLKVLLSSAKKKIPHELKSIKKHSIQIHDSSQTIVYLPIYYLIIPYQNKKYYYVMNGEDGEIYFSKVESKKSIIIFSVILFFIIFTILCIMLKFF